MNIIEDIDKYSDQLTIDIECPGYMDGEEHLVGEQHVPYRRIRVQDDGRIIRCRSCQKEHKKVYNRDLLREKRSEQENAQGE